MTPLTDLDLARLYAHLRVPVAVASILDRGVPMSDGDRAGLCDMIGAQPPDQALLSVAIGSMILDARLRDAGVRAAEVLALSAEMMVQDYAPPYLAHLSSGQSGGLFDSAADDLLATVGEDLESLSDLLAVVADVIPDPHGLFRDVAQVLSAQAGAQALVADAVLGLMRGLEDTDHVLNDDAARIPITAATGETGEDNVVPFKR